jgi:hypothetical protein
MMVMTIRSQVHEDKDDGEHAQLHIGDGQGIR